MPPAPGSGHPDDTSPPTSTMLSGDYHQNGANPTLPPSSSIPPLPSSWYGGDLPSYLTPVSVATDVHGIVSVVVLDGKGHSVFSYNTPETQVGQSSTTASPLQNSSPTSTFLYKTSNPSALSTDGTQSQPSQPIVVVEGSGGGEHHGPPFPAIVAMGIIIPSLLIILSLCAFFFYIRKKRKMAANYPKPEMVAARRVNMKDSGVGGGPDLMTTRTVASAGSVSTSGAAAPSHASPTSTSSAAPGTPPVILSTSMNDSYYTGIDTSDHISLTDQRSEASVDTFGEEPPPPYRPRSVPPMSREASVRNSMCRNTSARSRHDPMSVSNLMGGGHARRSFDVRSPFDDPEDSDDDNLSQISTLRSLPRHDTDQLSVVSDMSYLEEPTQTHSTVG